MGFVTRPVSLIILVIAVLTFVWPMLSKMLKKKA